MRLFVTLCLSLLTAVVNAQPAQTPAAEPNDLASALESHVRFLAALQPARNFYHPESLDAAADYIAQELDAAGWPVQRQRFSAAGNEYQNVRTVIGPADAPRLVIGAHYDVHGELPGADDNASGVAVLLELARMLSGYEPEIGLELVAFTLEEQPAFSRGFMGSDHHALQLQQQEVEVAGMMSLEMLGYYSDQPGSQGFPVPGLGLLYPDAGNFLALIGRAGDWPLLWKTAYAMQTASDLPVHYLASPLRFDGIARSDHHNYWDAGWPAILVTDTAFYRNPNYHEPTDTADTLDYGRMAAVVPGLAAAVRALTQETDAETASDSDKEPHATQDNPDR